MLDAIISVTCPFRENDGTAKNVHQVIDIYLRINFACINIASVLFDLTLIILKIILFKNMHVQMNGIFPFIYKIYFSYNIVENYEKEVESRSLTLKYF